MAKNRIPDTTIMPDYYDGDILYGEDINKIISVFKEGINRNKLDINRIISGGDYFFIADDLAGLTALIQEQVPVDGQKGYIFDGDENEGSIEVYLYNDSSGSWVYNSTRIFSGIDIQTSETQPVGQLAGDFWYDISD